MEANTLIDSYVDDIARRLPRGSRADVALELRSALAEQLDAAAAGAGHAPDRELTLEVLGRFGRPDEVAARYLPEGVNIVEPGLAAPFLKAVVACVGMQWAFTLPNVLLSSMTLREWALGWGIGAFWWVGVLVAWFAAAAWVRRRSPADPASFRRPWTHGIFWLPFVAEWRPEKLRAPRVDTGVARRLAPVTLGLTAALIAFLVAPAWFLERWLPAGSDVSWAVYAEGFRRELLWPLILLVAARLVLAVAAHVDARWKQATEGIRVALWIGFVGALCWVVLAWDILAVDRADLVFKGWLLIFLAANTIQIVVRVRGAVLELLAPALTAGDLTKSRPAGTS